MTKLQAVLWLGAVATASQCGWIAMGQGKSDWAALRQADPANLMGEQVQPAGSGSELPINQGAAALEGNLRRLRTRASLMLIVAHPDDEDGGMLTYESRGKGVRTGMLTLNRGEGGQNVVTGDFNDALGLLRTQELLSADRMMGVHQMFGTEADFGFSKTKEEAFAQWGHQRVLYDAVRAVRLYRPMVVASVFVGAPSDGHGHHQVSGEIAQEVFRAAADPKVFPEMGLPVWAPLKVYARVPFAQINSRGMFDYATGKYVPVRFENYVTGAISNTAPRADVEIPEGDQDPLLGMSYVQFARKALALQRTQIGAGVRVAPAGAFDVGYTRYGSRVPEHGKETGFFDGVDVSLEGLLALAPSWKGSGRGEMERGLARLDGLAARAAKEFSAGQPQAIAPVLRDGLAEVDALIAQTGSATGLNHTEQYDLLHELRIKRVQFNDALTEALGLSLAKVAVEGARPLELVPGQKAELRVQLAKPSSEVKIVASEMEQNVTGSDGRVTAREQPMGPDGSEQLAKGSAVTTAVTVPTGDLGSRPPFTRKNLEQSYYTVADSRLRNAPAAPPALTAWVEAEYRGVRVRFGRVAGELQDGVYQPVSVVPEVSVAVSPGAGVVPLDERNFMLRTRVSSVVPGQAGEVRTEVPSGWKAAPGRQPWRAPQADEAVATPFRITPGHLAETPYLLSSVASSGGHSYREGYRAVGYPGVVHTYLFTPAVYRARGVDVSVPPGLRIAYLPGTGDDVEASLEEIGVHATTVSVAEIAAGRLSDFDVLVLGVRVYAAQPALPAATPKLLAWVHAGGVAILQYNSGEYNHAYGPYPYSLGTSEKVVDETSRVDLLNPSAQVLSWPNHITGKDFDGWVEERGHGFMGSWDPHFQAPTEVHDPGQDPQRGGLLVAPYGKGVYVYCAFALYRQLPEGVPGSFRIFANLLSLGRSPTAAPAHPSR